MPDIGTDIPTPPALSATSDFPATPVEAPAAASEPAASPADQASDQASDQEAAPPQDADAADQASEGDAQEESATEPPPRDRRQSLSQRLSEVTAARRAAEAREARLAEMVEKLLDQQQARTQQPDEKTPEQVAPRPKREEFDDPDAYDSALIEWSTNVATRAARAEADREASERRAAEERERTEAAARTEQERVMAAWNGARDKLMETPEYQDWEQVATNPDLEIPVTMAAPIVNADNGPMVLYHLGKNPGEAARIAKLTPVQQAIEIGKLSAKLSEPPRPVRRLQPPIDPVGQRNGAAEKTPDEMSMDEYAAKRNAELAASQRRGSVFGRA